MGRRNPQNPRYRKESLGKTRRSAASAKPKKAAGDRSSSSAGKPKGSKSTPTGWRKFFQPLPTPDTAEFKMWRKIWAGLFAAGIAFTLVALLQWERQVGTWLLVGAYACLFGAIFIDVAKIRKLRRAYADELEGKPSGKKTGGKSSEGKSSGKKGDE